MIKELIHYITLTSRTRSSLRQCAEIIDNNISDEPSIRETTDNYIKQGKIGLTVDLLIEKGEKYKVSDSGYWSRLYVISKNHKMKDKILLLSGKVSHEE